MKMDDRSYRFVFKDLQPGVSGLDGVSPTVDVTEIEGGHRLTITDVHGEKIPVDILDGISPTVEVQPELGGHQLTVTDVEGSTSFYVRDGLDPLKSVNALTDYLLGQSCVNLIEYTGGTVSGEDPVVTLTGNRVTATDLTESGGTEELCFLISSGPRKLTNGAADLTDEDFFTINYDHTMNLYCRVSGMVEIPGEDSGEYRPKIIVCAKPSNSSQVLTTVCGLSCGHGGDGVRQFGDAVYPVYDGDLRHEDITLQVAVLLVLYPYYQNCDLTADFYFGQIDFNSELAQNVNVIGTYNNSMYAENPYHKDDLIIQNDRLYRANWDIAHGNRIDAGYDISPTTVSDELKALRARVAALEGGGGA